MTINGHRLFNNDGFGVITNRFGRLKTATAEFRWAIPFIRPFLMPIDRKSGSVNTHGNGDVVQFFKDYFVELQKQCRSIGRTLSDEPHVIPERGIFWNGGDIKQFAHGLII